MQKFEHEPVELTMEQLDVVAGGGGNSCAPPPKCEPHPSCGGIAIGIVVGVGVAIEL
jgi:hypothetical protein